MLGGKIYGKVIKDNNIEKVILKAEAEFVFKGKK
jgi:hypothetical protein